MSIRPEWVAKILNGEKTIEIRKKFQKDYVGWVYIYCTKGKLDCFVNGRCYTRNKPTNKEWYKKFPHITYLNGKVVARFWCDKVEEIKLPYTKFGTNERVNGEFERTLQTETMDEETLLNKSCLSEEEIYKYLNFKHSPNYCGTAIHITKLEILDKPKEISKFCGTKRYFVGCGNAIDKTPRYAQLHHAPQSWCYIEDVL